MAPSKKKKTVAVKVTASKAARRSQASPPLPKIRLTAEVTAGG